MSTKKFDGGYIEDDDDEPEIICESPTCDLLDFIVAGASY